MGARHKSEPLGGKTIISHAGRAYAYAKIRAATDRERFFERPIQRVKNRSLSVAARFSGFHLYVAHP